MSLVKRNYYTAPSLNRFFDDFFTRDLFVNGENELPKYGSTPAVNIAESDSAFELELAAPGLSKKDFSIEVNDDLLTISFERNEEKEVKNRNYKMREFGYSSFKRSFTLPETTDSAKIEAKYENGILNLSIPKKPEAQPQPIRTIKIS
ncbi:MAG: Hsp20/alpha crystallin family protein [Cyclobacteriaceae bacterium]